MKTRKKRPKLIYGQSACIREWVSRVSTSPDPDNDPNVNVSTSTNGIDWCSDWAADESSGSYRWVYTSMHPMGMPSRKLAANGRKLMVNELTVLSTYVGGFWLVSSHDHRGEISRVRNDIYKELPEDSFAFVPDSLLVTHVSDITSRWDEFEQSFIDRIDMVGEAKLINWVTNHQDLVFKSVVKEYANLADHFGMPKNIDRFAVHTHMAEQKLNAKKVLAKLKDK